MAWSISINTEGWGKIEEELGKLSPSELVDAIWDDNQTKRKDYKRLARFRDLPRPARFKRSDLELLSHETLIGMAFDLVRQNDTCENGGYQYWIDIDGFHTVTIED